MGIASSSQPSLRARVLPRFPAKVLAGGGILISKNGLTYTFSVDPAFFADLPLSDLVDIPTDTLLGRDTPSTGSVEVITVGNGIKFSGAGKLITDTDPAGGLGLNGTGQLKVVNDPAGGLGFNGNQLKIADIPTDSLLGRDTAGTGVVENITVANGLQFNGSKVLLPSVNNRTRQLSIAITGAPITTGVKYDWIAPFDCVITGVTLLGDQTGSIVVDLRKSTFSAFTAAVPGSGNSICASALPTISSAIKFQDTTLTGWTTAVANNDVIRFNVNSITTFTRVTVNLSLRVDT